MDMSSFNAAAEQTHIMDFVKTPEYDQMTRARDEDALVDMESQHRLDEIAWQINMRENRAKDVFRRTALEIGEYLVEAQRLCPRGRWGEWLREKVDYSERKAQQLMQVYEGYRDKRLTADYDALSFTQIYQLLAAPEEARDALAHRAAEEDMSTRALKAEIDRLKAEAEDQQQRMEIETAEAYRDGAAHGKEDAEKLIAALKARAEMAEQQTAKAEGSIKTIRETAAKANDRAAEAEARARKAEEKAQKAEARAKKAEEAASTAKAERVEVVPAETEAEIEGLQEALRRTQAEYDRIKAERDALAARAAPENPPADELTAAMDGVKAALTRAVAAIKAAEPSAAKRAKDALMVICTAITKKIGGSANDAQ